MKEVRVALVGVGNCASALVQGIEFYRNNPDAPGLMARDIAGLTVGDIRVVAAFDVNSAKVGWDLAQAIHAAPNNTRRFADVPATGVTVAPGPRLDGVGRSASTAFRTVRDVDGGDVVSRLVHAGADVVVNFLPVGSEGASRFYAEQALEAGCGFVNAIPTKIARDPDFAAAYEAHGLPLIGDDVKSQLGATIIHRILAETFSRRGTDLLNTYQLNVGGNLDFLNMLDRERLAEKRESKSTAVTSVANGGRGIPDENVHIGPSDYVPWLGDRKVAFVRMEGAAFGGAPLEVELKMTVWDSPNSAGVVVDAVRYIAAARASGAAGVLEESSWLMKAPPVALPEDVGYAIASRGHEPQDVYPAGRDRAA